LCDDRVVDASSGSAGVRMSELLAAVSLGTDLGMGHPMEHVLRQTFLALRLGEEIGLGVDDLDVVFHSSMMAWVGCHIDAYEQAKWFGDDCALKHDARSVDFGRPVASSRFLVRHLGHGRSAAERARIGARFLGDGVKHMQAMLENHWRAADQLAEQLGLGEAVRANIAQTFERWDGKGDPGEVSGADVLIASRLVNLADVVEVFHTAGGVEAAVGVAESRRGTQFDPGLVDAFCDRARDLFAELDQVASWEALFAHQTFEFDVLDDDRLDAALAAIGDFVDLKTPFAIGHARNVSALASAAGEELELPANDVRMVKRAALVHDFGQLGVPNSIWDKPGPLTPSEVERVRLHPYYVDRMFASCALAPIGRLAAAHHERLDGSGYPRASTGDALSVHSRILAAADVYQTKLERRPHRPPMDAMSVEAHLRAEVRAGRFDGDAVDAVLRAAGHRVRRKREWPAGLTAREVEVLRLVAQGLSHRQIAERLVISRKTASNHVERIYGKIGVSNRAMASVFAMTHGLMLANDADALDPT
jgi:HD-GYP domain-containing protein (c-di-GMP phosphodiesterase class II)